MRQPYWRKSCKAWYVLHDEKQYCLGKTKEESERAVHELMVGQTEPTPRATVNEVVSQFLSWTDGHRSALTYEWYCHFLNSFTALYGELRVSELEPFHVTR